MRKVFGSKGILSQENDDASAVILVPELDGEEAAPELLLVESVLEEDEEIDPTAGMAETEAALESICMAMEHIESRNFMCSKEEIALLTRSVNLGMSYASESFSSTAMESYGISVEERNKLAMEGLNEALNRLHQQFVIGFKQRANIIGDLFRSTNSSLNKYRSRMEEVKGLYNSRKGDLNTGVHTGSLVSLWQLFMTNGKQRPDVVNALKTDCNYSKYILNEYIHDVSAEMTKFTGIVSNASGKTDEAVGKALSRTKDITHPCELFDSKLLSSYPLLGNRGYQIKHGSKPAPVMLGDAVLSNLAKLAASDRITTYISASHVAKRVGANATGMYGAIAELGLSADIKFTTQDIGTVIEYGFKYLDNIDTYTHEATRFFKEHERNVDAISKMVEHSELSSSEFARAVSQSFSALKQFSEAAVSPGKAEMKRSMACVKYCAYIAKRMIWDAK